MKNIAVARLHLSDGKVLKRRILTFDDFGKLLSHAPLVEETPFTEWRGGDYYLSFEGL